MKTLAVAVCLSASTWTLVSARTVPSDLAMLLASAGRYVQSFERDFAIVISEETYRQRIDVDQGSLSSKTISRELQSELLFMWVPDDRQWTAIRNVLAVDKKRISDGGLESVLKQPLAERDSRLHLLAEHNAQFNIGSIYRNFNTPTLVLQFLDPDYRPRFAFTVEQRDETINGASARKITFKEMQRPTVIVERGEDRPSSGAIWVRPDDGTVIRTSLNVIGSLKSDATIVVDYRRDAKMNMWVPSRMEEHYHAVATDNPGGRMNRATRFNKISGVATYTNVKRFETSGRVIQHH